MVTKVIAYLSYFYKKFKIRDSDYINNLGDFIKEGSIEIKQVNKLEIKQLNIKNSLHILRKIYVSCNSNERIKIYQSNGENIIIRVENHRTPIYLSIYAEEVQVCGKSIEEGEMIIYINKILRDTIYRIEIESIKEREFLSFLEVRQK
ncbi:hypothetical protein [Niameybacter massiliensis]|uniref:hypothetical protein n=1 Tax=Niameybacter massiliensis TaxID=1658108 RepID=UPI0018E209F4|nr:hypothetical protein [Niameybacter massiliensis]